MEPRDDRPLVSDERREGDADAPGRGGSTPDVFDRGGHLGFVAHEVRNPLSTALWTAELLARLSAADRGGARGEKLTAMCLRSISRVRQLVEDHFLCERLDAGGLALRLEATGIREALDAVLERRPPDAGPVDAPIDPALAVEADRGLLERALESLVAVAGAERTPVAVSAHAADDGVAIVVTGRPADPGALADPVKGAPSDATGRALALPVARRIAEALGGALAAKDGGWCLMLPRAPSDGPRRATDAGP
jgi:K+-sensing histidine kinase KdpD